MKAWARNNIRERVPEGTVPQMTPALWVLALIGFPSTARRSLIDHLRALTALPGDRFGNFPRDVEGIVVSGRPRQATVMCATRHLLREWPTALEDVAPPDADPDFPRIRERALEPRKGPSRA
jgi:hypothetical protein